MALHGGVLLYGLDEQPNGARPGLTPADLDATIERISNIAATGVSPPVRPRFDRIETGGGWGVLFVRIPASPLAPHQAAKRYWCRSGHGNQPMADEEVRRYLAAQRASRDWGAAALDTFVADDPFTVSQNGHPHILLLPVVEDPTRLLRAIGTQHRDWAPFLEEVGRAGDRRTRHPSFQTRAGGVALVRGIGPSRVAPEGREATAQDLELGEYGSVRLYHGGAVTVPQSAEGPHANEAVIGAMTRLALSAGRLVIERTGYSQPWLAGIHVSGLRGAQSLIEERRREQSSFESGVDHRYSGNEYRKVVELLGDDLVEDKPRGAIDALLGEPFRGLHGGANYDVFDETYHLDDPPL